MSILYFSFAAVKRQTCACCLKMWFSALGNSLCQSRMIVISVKSLIQVCLHSYICHCHFEINHLLYSCNNAGFHFVGRVPSSSSSSAPGYISLDSGEGTVIFIRVLIKCKDDFPKHGSHDSALEKVRLKLLKMDICTTTELIRTKRKNLLCQHRRNTRENKMDHEYFIPCSVITGTLGEDVVKETKFDPDGIVNSDMESDSEETEGNKQMLKFCKGERCVFSAGYT